jgi:hypothetical protein
LGLAGSAAARAGFCGRSRPKIYSPRDLSFLRASGSAKSVARLQRSATVRQITRDKLLAQLVIPKWPIHYGNNPPKVRVRGIELPVGRRAVDSASLPAGYRGSSRQTDRQYSCARFRPGVLAEAIAGPSRRRAGGRGVGLCHPADAG